MEFTYETVGTATFLTCTAQADEFDPFSLKMLEHNTVDGLLPFSSILENRVRKIRYTVTSCETLESYISRPLPLANILNILEITVDMLLYFRNVRLDKKREAEQK